MASPPDRVCEMTLEQSAANDHGELATNHAAATDRGSTTIADGAPTISDCSAANHGGPTVTDCSTGAISDCSAGNHCGATVADCSAGAITDRSATDHGPSAITDNSAPAISDCSTPNHGGTTVSSGPEWANVIRTIHSASTYICTRFRTANGDKTSNKAQDYDRISHAASFPAPMSLRQMFTPEARYKAAMHRKVLKSGLRPIRAREFP